MPKYTSPPWKVDLDQYGCKVIKGGKPGRHKQAQYKRIATTEGVFPEEEDAANAKLMTASPVLLNACKVALSGYRAILEFDLLPHSGYDKGTEEMIDVLESAIREAE